MINTNISVCMYENMDNFAYFYLLAWHFKAEGLVVVRVQRVFLDRSFLFLESFPILH